VDDEVDRQPPRLGLEGAHGVGAHARPLFARQPRLDVLHVERRAVARAGRRELELDVVIGELAGTEAREVVTGDDHAGQVGRELAGFDDGCELGCARH
jgi:hypothetical protein